MALILVVPSSGVRRIRASNLIIPKTKRSSRNDDEHQHAKRPASTSNGGSEEVVLQCRVSYIQPERYLERHAGEELIDYRIVSLIPSRSMVP